MTSSPAITSFVAGSPVRRGFFFAWKKTGTPFEESVPVTHKTLEV